ncbi:hypothetical protein [Streptomyces sp. NPDC087300]|uniref:hypothetical protein n=1 Tax=Streptomyces sp. NPDC087300 TaxID=3365780 RepID=UPI00381FEB61
MGPLLRRATTNGFPARRGIAFHVLIIPYASVVYESSYEHTQSRKAHNSPNETHRIMSEESGVRFAPWRVSSHQVVGPNGDVSEVEKDRQSNDCPRERTDRINHSFLSTPADAPIDTSRASLPSEEFMDAGRPGTEVAFNVGGKAEPPAPAVEPCCNGSTDTHACAGRIVVTQHIAGVLLELFHAAVPFGSQPAKNSVPALSIRVPLLLRLTRGRVRLTKLAKNLPPESAWMTGLLFPYV